MGFPSRRGMPGTGRVGCTTDRFWCSSPARRFGAGRAGWLQRSSWIGLAVAAGLGLGVSAVVRRRLIRAAEKLTTR